MPLPVLEDIDVTNLPLPLAHSVRRVLPDGRPTQYTLDTELLQREWFSDTVVDLSTNITNVSASFGQFSANGEIYFAATATPTGSTAAYGVFLTADDSFAGLAILAQSGGGSAIGMTANQFTFTDSGTSETVFAYSGGIFRFGVPVEILTGDIGLGQITGLATNTGSISTSTLSVTKSFYGGTDALVIVTLEPASGVSPSPSDSNAITQRTYTVALDTSTLVGTIKAYDVCIGSNQEVVRNAADTGSEGVVGGLSFYPQGGAKQFLVTGVSAGSHTFSVDETYGLAMDAAITVIEFKR